MTSNETVTVDTQDKLDSEVLRLQQDGYAVMGSTNTSVSLSKGKNLSHGLHLFLTIITGVWGFVWIGLAIFGGKQTVTIALSRPFVFV